MRILVVDDSKAMRMIVSRAVRQTGVATGTISECENGREALDFLRTTRPSLVLSDWNMPEMTGIELLQALRAEGNDVPFGFVTSESTESMRSTAEAAGAAFLIAKPFTREAFEEHLGSFV